MKNNYVINIRALFEGVLPERVLDSMRNNTFNTKTDAVTAFHITPNVYRNVMRSVCKEMSFDEINQEYRNLQDILSKREEIIERARILALPALYAGEVLLMDGGYPLCKEDNLLGFRMISFDLGQDIFTCAGLAAYDIRHRLDRNDFAWSECICTDNKRLQQLYERGLAENHFHLKGSTQSAALAWGFLMNYPSRAHEYFRHKEFHNNLKSTIGNGNIDNVMGWPDRIYYAAYIRNILFKKAVLGINNRMELKKIEQNFDIGMAAQRMSSAFRLSYGTTFIQENHRYKCLDYAIVNTLSSKSLKSTERYLSGERYLLYRSFKCAYSGLFNEEECSLLYTYLLLRNCFRAELVQVNKIYGFLNFSDYQARKDIGWEEIPEYKAESLRLSAASAMAHSVNSLEMRIMPKERLKLMETVKGIDSCIEFMTYDNVNDSVSKRLHNAEQSADYFYVLHFAKCELPQVKEDYRNFFNRERHYKKRCEVRYKGQQVAMALKYSSYLCSRVRGIDACSTEIGCRPEIFAPTMRFLRNYNYANKFFYKKRYLPKIGVTYHVGEDFLDLIDGMRAVDEAVRYIHLKNGDRIGHCLALGIEPAQYYELKHGTLSLPIQDLLDNFIWFMHSAARFGVDIPVRVLENMREHIVNSLWEVYGLNSEYIEPYYKAWILRGDDPALYRTEADINNENKQAILKQNDRFRAALEKYKRFGLDQMQAYYTDEGFVDSEFDYDTLRMDLSVRQILYMYHFDSKVRYRGQKIMRFTPEPELISCIRQIQECMLGYLEKSGIGIECNPSSNYLIGTFRRYDKHPMMRFNSHQLPWRDSGICHELLTSINTDDIGVFDTSLENEYALMYNALIGMKDDNGNQFLGPQTVMDYLEGIRQNGQAETFEKSVRK